jgi:hypothetical protein
MLGGSWLSEEVVLIISRMPGFEELPMEITMDGHEDMYVLHMVAADTTSHQVNVLSQVLLVILVHDLLVIAPAARVVFTTSDGHA